MATDPVLMGFSCFMAGTHLGGALAMLAAPPRRCGSEISREREQHHWESWVLTFIYLLTGTVLSSGLVVSLACK